MKSIIIAGIARAGKTTVCTELSKRGYNHWLCDSLIYTFEKIFPQLKINQEESTQGVKNTSRKFAPFLNCLINTIESEKLQNPAVLDIYQLMPEDYVQYIGKDTVDAYFLGYPDITVEEEFRILRANQVPEEYTLKYEDDYLRNLIKQRIDESKYVQEECKKYQLPFINTSYHRKEQIMDLVKHIVNSAKNEPY